MAFNFKCEKCKRGVRLPHGAKLCPFCGGQLTSESYNTAQNKIAEAKALLPELENKYNEYAQLYAQFTTIKETLRVYAARGIISREEVPNFDPQTLTSIFYKSRYKKIGGSQK